MQTIRSIIGVSIAVAWFLVSLPLVKTAAGQTTPAMPVPYSEPLRPQFHFTYKVGWLSDVNGPFCYRGEYHLFTQHVPGGPGLDYTKIHWGHAISKDLLRWEEMPPALAPDEHGPVFSGGGECD